MKVAFTYNLKLTSNEEEAEFDTPETVDAVTQALTAAGHQVEKIEVSGSASHLVSRLEAFEPDLIFNSAEGRRGKAREGFYAALFEELGIPYSGSDAHTLTVTLDKWLTKLVVAAHGVDCPRGRLVTAADLSRTLETGLGLAFPVIVKPNFEGSSMGIGDDAVVRDPKALAALLRQAVQTYPAGVIVEEFIPGSDVAVGYLSGVGDDGVLAPAEYVIEPQYKSRYNLYEYKLKNQHANAVDVRCPADLPRDVSGRLRAIASTVFRVLNVRDIGRIDFRIGDDGRIHFLEVNALPSLERGAGLFAAAAQAGLSYEKAISQVVKSAAKRCGIAMPEEPGAAAAKKKQIRVGFAYNIKRVDSKGGNDREAEYDPPETIAAIAEAIASHGHVVVPLEVTPDVPRLLAEANVDLVFNIAEGLFGRNREAQLPALCELLGLPYTGSDSSTLAIALDKAVTKKVLRQHGVLTPEFQVFETGRERLSAALRFPVIVKPNAEGSSKGIASTGVVDNEADMREVVKQLLEKYRQPALVEEYITGREFTVGLLGDKRPRVLPPMEICFRDKSQLRPIYDYQVKQEWEKHVEYKCPASLTSTEQRAIERAARETFEALDCRDVARVDLRMSADGKVYVLEVNPLPGLTPDYSDLVLISKAAKIDYRTLIGEILAGGIKRLKEKRREKGDRGDKRDASSAPAASQPGNAQSVPASLAIKAVPSP